MARRIKDDDYVFMQIEDAMACINQWVSFVGVVTEASLPKHSYGTDFFCSIKVIDESRISPPTTVTFFADKMGKLPYIESVGDIIILTRVMPKMNANVQNVVYHKKRSSFALFRGKDHTDMPYQVSPNFKAWEQGKDIVKRLRSWFMLQKFESDSNDLSLVKDMKEGEHINFLCKVLDFCEVTKDEWMLFVWDGTDAPPASIGTNLEDEMRNPLPVQLEPSPLSRSTLCTFPPVGTVLRMVSHRGNRFGIELLRRNDWVKLIQVKCEVHTGLWLVVLMPSSKLYYLHNNGDLVLQRERCHDDRGKSKCRRMPMSSFLEPYQMTETDYPDVPYVTLMNVLTHKMVTYKFKCVVRIVAAFPWLVEDFRNPQGIYRVRFTLEDPTARIYAFLYAEDGVQFFGRSNSVDELKRKVNVLLGIGKGDNCQNSVSRNPPWIQCCLKSYYIDKSVPWGSRNYRIFATRFLGSAS